MTKTSVFRTKPSEPSISAAAKAVFLPASHTEVPLNRGGFPVTAALEVDLEPAWNARCLWCQRIFTPRTTGGSAQKFCCTGHRQQFWIAARRWTMRAIEAGLLSVECLKGVSHERARCLRRHSAGEHIPIIEAYRAKSEPSYARSCITASRPANRARVFPER